MGLNLTDSLQISTTELFTGTNMKTASTTSSSSKRPRILAGSAHSSPDAAREHTLAMYESALRLMQDGKFDKAHAAFNQMLASSPVDLAERIRVYINACLQQMHKHKAQFSSDEERYDYAVSLLNEGHYDDARTQLNQILGSNKNADYAFYGLAVLSSMTGDAHSCLEHLTEAIRLNPRNRIQARSDSDFQDVADDPRFTELLYPEI
jgi:tetratricopeptide (TPR) repeat protein